MLTFLLAAALAAVTPPAAAPLAGDWTLDFPASTFGPDHQEPGYQIARSLSVDGATVVQSDQTTNMTLFNSAAPPVTAKFTLTADGAEHSVAGLNRIPMVASNPVLPSKTTAIARWEGDTLVYAARGVDVLGAWSATHRLFVTDDGARLVDVATIISYFGESERTYVFRRKK